MTRPAAFLSRNPLLCIVVFVLLGLTGAYAFVQGGDLGGRFSRTTQSEAQAELAGSEVELVAACCIQGDSCEMGGDGQVASCCVGTPARSELLALAIATQAAVAERNASMEDEEISKNPPTFCKDVAPILQRHCQECHREDQIGPFPLMTYEQTRKRAVDIALVTDLRRMPPWPASPDFGTGFRHDRSLSETEIATLNAWAESGTPEGDPADLPPPIEFTEGWTLGSTPDLVIEIPEDFQVPADGSDLYRCFVIPNPLDEDAQVIGLEYQPGNPSVVHHILGYVDVSGNARKLADAEDGKSYECFGGPMIDIQGDLGGWAPGANATRLPEGIGRNLPKGSDIVLQIHYHPNGKPESDRSRLGLYLAPKDQPIRQAIHWWATGTEDFEIPEDQANFKIDHRNLPLPLDVELLAVSPHMHLLGKDITMTAELPDGTVQKLIEIDQWDFNWQLQYYFQEPIALPAGTVMRVVAHYDNSTSNPHRPELPRTVTYGEATTDEMCWGFFGMVKAGQDLTQPDEKDDLLAIMFQQLKEYQNETKARAKE